MVKLACAMLETFGFQVDSASGALEAVDLLEKGDNYDLVLTDLNMPEMNGYELACRVKCQAQKVVVVVMTGCRASAELYSHNSSSPIDGWLFKPFGFSELKSLLCRFSLMQE